MELKQIDIDAEAIFQIYKTKGVKAASEKYAEIVNEKKLDAD